MNELKKIMMGEPQPKCIVMGKKSCIFWGFMLDIRPGLCKHDELLIITLAICAN